MNKFINTILGSIDGKKEWKSMELRAKALPNDYQVVYSEIKKYIWKSSGISTIEPFKRILELFEENAAQGNKVLDITGDDVATFCDELVRGEKSYTQDWHVKLNKDIAKKLNNKESK